MKKQIFIVLTVLALLLAGCTPKTTTTANTAGFDNTPAVTNIVVSSAQPTANWLPPTIDADGTYHFGVGQSALTAQLLTDFAKGKVTLDTSYGSYTYEDGAIKINPKGTFADSYNNYTGPDMEEADYASAAYIGLQVQNNLEVDAYFGLQGSRKDRKPLLLTEKGSNILLAASDGSAWNAEVTYQTYRYCITVPAGFAGYILIPADRLCDSDGIGQNNASEPVNLWKDEGCSPFAQIGFHVTAGGKETFDIHNLFIGKEVLPKVEKNWTQAGIENSEYSYTDEQRIMPFWKSNIMYNESLTFEQKGDDISGALLFVPTRIISIVDNSLKKEFKEGVDFEWVKGTNKVKWLNGSAIPYFYEGALQGYKEPGSQEKVAAGAWDAQGRQLLDNCLYCVSSFLYEKQVSVTYEYDKSQIAGEGIKYTAYQGDKLPKTLAKIKNNQDIKVLVVGASIAGGCDASGLYGRAPNMPTMSNLIKNYLSTQTTGKVTMTNFAFGGSTVQQCIDALTKTVDFQGTPYNFANKYKGYDLVILAGVMNDLNQPGVYTANKLKELVAQLRTESPDIEVLIYNNIVGNPEARSFHDSKSGIVQAVNTMAAEEGFALADTYGAHEKILKYKLYSSTSGNNINHPNDWLIRVDSQNILAAMFDFDKMYS